MENRPQNEPEAICDMCGKFGAFQFSDRTICLDCYESAGSCCPEFGGHDLWPEESPSPPPSKSDLKR